MSRSLVLLWALIALTAGLARGRLLVPVLSAWCERIAEWVALWSDWLLR